MSQDAAIVREDAAAPARLGTNQAGMRAANERLVLSLVRRAGALSKTDIARMTGLSAQTVSVIMRELERDSLLRRGEPKRGRVGQPAVPLSLDPEGAFFIGAKIGRRSLEVALVDFAGGVRHHAVSRYPFPTPQATIDGVLAEVAACTRLLGAQAERIAGLGLAMPFELWTWADEIDAPPDEIMQWRSVDVRAALDGRLPFPVYMQNDATAACGAELAFGTSGGLRDFLYFYVGAFVGGGLVLDGGLYAGRTGNAAALGSMLVPDGAGDSVQLINRASLVVLERRLRAAERPTDLLYDPGADWTAMGPELDRWLARAASGIAHATASALAILDFEAAVIDGALPAAVRDRLVAATAAALSRLDLSGLNRIDVCPGTMGPLARVLGGASLPLFERYLVGPDMRVASALPGEEPPQREP